MDEDYLADRRDEAKQHRGVWYDSRADKFAAEVYSRGERHFLGHFADAADAATAYAAARAEMPSGRVSEGTFVHAFQTFLSEAKRNHAGTPLAGEVLTYDGQQFQFEGTAFRRMGKGSRPFFRWSSCCRDCAEPYDTLTATSPAGAKGITRTCEEHRARKRKAPDESTSVPQSWIDAANAAADNMSLLSDVFPVSVFLQECWGRSAAPEGFIRFLTRDPKSPVVAQEGALRIRNS